MSPREARTPIVRVTMLSAAMAAATALLLAFLPDLSTSTLPARGWVWPIIVAAYFVAERAVFNFDLRHQSISFSLSEVPTAAALLWLAPGAAIGARALGTVVALLFLSRSRWYKLLFNLTMFSLELSIAFQLVRLAERWWPGSTTALVVAVIPATAVATVVGSVMVSAAMAIMEGGFVERVVAELRLTAWMAPLNGTVAAMTIVPAFSEPWLVVLPLVPIAGFWVVMRGYGRLEQRHRDLAALHGFVRRVGQSLDLDDIAQTSTDETALRLRAQRAAVVIFAADGSVACTASTGRPMPMLPTRIDDPAWAGPLGQDRAMRYSSDDLVKGALAPFAPIGGVAMATLRDGGEVLGLIVLAERESYRARIRNSDLARLDTIADQAAPSIRNARLHERLEHEARHDVLTDLANRAAFERFTDEFATAWRTGDTPPAVLLMDLDRFKEVNDTLGHPAGDAVLTELARRLRALLRPDERLARLAGDEFAILLHAESGDAVARAEQLLEAARVPYDIDGLEVVVTASVGVALQLAEGERSGTLLRRADIAMYAAKNRHSGVEVYRDEIDRRTPARLAMLGDLRNALQRDEFDVYLQPKLDLATGTVIGVEALARWSHSARGIVPPEDFVPVAEETGLIKQLTDAVLGRAVEQVHRLRNHGHHLGLAVNLSTHDLLDELLPDRVMHHLDRFAVDPALLTLEITESSLLFDAPRARQTIERLNRHGIRLAVDDFGTGYSSLAYLRHLPVSELKIDRSFVANLLFDQQDEVIVRSIIDLGHNLGLQVVAEGVETDEVVTRLRGFSCDVAQGYGICRPVPLERLLVWLGATQHPSRRRDPLHPSHWATPPTD